MTTEEPLRFGDIVEWGGPTSKARWMAIEPFQPATDDRGGYVGRAIWIGDTNSYKIGEFARPRYGPNQRNYTIIRREEA